MLAHNVSRLVVSSQESGPMKALMPCKWGVGGGGGQGLLKDKDLPGDGASALQ